MSSHRLTLIAAALLGGLSAAGASAAQDLPPGAGREVVQTACTQCHGSDVIAAQGHTEEEWKEVLARMIGNGASLDDNQFVTVLNYLSTALGPAGAAKPTAQAAPATPSDPTQH